MKKIPKTLFVWLSIFTFAAIFRFQSTQSIISTLPEDKVGPKLQEIITYCDNSDSNKFNQCFRDKVTPLVLSNSAAEIITQLEKQFTKNNTNNYSDKIACHTIGHIVGEIDGANSRNIGESLAKCTTECGNACYHGILIGAIKTHPDILNTLSQVCKNFESFDFPGQQLTACNHGLGHGLAEYTADDTIKSLSYCDQLESVGAKTECGSGVFMETIDDANTDKTLKLFPDDITDFCITLTQPYKDLCLRNVGNYRFRLTNSVPEAFSACEKLDKKFLDLCLGSLGADFFFIIKADTDELNKICQNAKPDKVDVCLEGSIMSSLVTDPRGDITLRICALSPTLRSNCILQLSESLIRLQGKQFQQEFCNKLVYNDKIICLSNTNENR